MGEKKKAEKKEEEKERVLERETHLLSKFPDGRTGVYRQSKRKSSSSRQGLRIETGVGEFRQTPRGRGFLLLGLILV